MRKRLWILVVWLAFVYSSFARMPLTYDETWNYNETAVHGPFYALTNYNFNNHVLYTWLTSLLPHDLVTRNPFFMRIPNWITILGAFTLIGLFFETPFRSWKALPRAAGWLPLLLFTSAVFASSELIFFSLVGRGYLMGCTLGLAAVYFRRPRFNAWFSDVLLVLASYAMFTVSYTWPGLLLVDLVEQGASLEAVKRVVVRWTRSTLLLALLYAPLVTGMRKMVRDYQLFKPTWQYTLRMFHAAYDWHWISLPLLTGILAAGIGTYLIARWNQPADVRAERPAPLFAAYLSCAVLSYFAVVEVVNIFQIVEPPYERNAMFVSLYGILAAGLSALVWLPEGRPKGVTGVARLVAAIAAFAVISVNAVVTAGTMLPPLWAGMYYRLPVSMVDCPLPITNRFLNSLPQGTEVFCGGFAGEVCWPFRPNMAKDGLKIYPGNDDNFERERRIDDCWSGTEFGGRGCSLYVRRTATDPFQPLCY
ncbi:MAG: hypothetical protein HY048_04480 [Acidobacteria bacterium]|nr:hypothetical protein [Acidobacteriota bacterium]